MFATESVHAPKWVENLSPNATRRGAKRATAWAGLTAFVVIGADCGGCRRRRLLTPRSDFMKGTDSDRQGRMVLTCTQRTWPRNFRW